MFTIHCYLPLKPIQECAGLFALITTVLNLETQWHFIQVFGFNYGNTSLLINF